MPYKVFGLETLMSADINTYLMSQVIIRCTSTTRPASPTEGWHIYETDTDKFLVYKLGTWVAESDTLVWALKTADEAYSVTTLHGDTQLTIPMAANSTYWMEAYFVVSNPTNSYGFVFQWIVPSGASMRYAANQVVTDPHTGPRNSKFFAATDQINMRVETIQNMTNPRGVVTTGSTAGNLQLNWRSGGGATTLYKNSFLILQLLT